MSSTVRRALGVCALAFIVFGGLRPDLFVILFADRRPLQRELAVAADVWAPSYPDFLREVWRRTEPGQRIVVLFGPAKGEFLSWYASYRARYFLPERTVETVDSSHLDSRLAVSVGDPVVAAWGIELPRELYETIWSGNGGELARRRR